MPEMSSTGDDRKPRLLCVMQLPPPVHGASVMNQHVASSAVLADHFDVRVIPLHFATSIADLNQLSARKLGRALSIAIRLTSALVRERPDIIYFTLSPVGSAFYRDCVYVGIMKLFGVPHVFHLHGKGISMQVEHRWRRALYSWVFRDAGVIHLSRLVAFDTSTVSDPDRVCYVPNGAPDHFGTASKSPRNGPPRVLYLSTMIMSKGPLVLVDALGILSARGVSFEATFAGPQYSDGCIAAFDEAVARLGLTGHVRYVGPVYGEAKDELLRSHDVFAFPTYYETFPLVILEAMQYCLPVVTTPEGAIPEIVEDGETGFLVPPRDAIALADRLQELLVDEALRREMGLRARRRYLDRYTIERFEHELVRALEQCV
jgi:glycosyltransferase involved in cell wall biosynthesis